MPFGDVEEPSPCKCQCTAKTDDLNRKWTRDRCSSGSFEYSSIASRAASTARGKEHRQRQRHHIRSGTTGHTEAVEIRFDNQQISFEQLLEYFWVNIDPLDGGGQFCDRGQQYRSELFYLSDRQQLAAQASIAALEAQPQFAGKIKTQLRAAAEFYVAEGYHQDYYLKNPTRYNYYRWSCGRDKRLGQLWGKEG